MSKKIKREKVERETIILYNEAEVMAEIYTHDRVLIKHLMKIREMYPDYVTKVDPNRFIVPKECVGVRKPMPLERRETARRQALERGLGRKK